MIRLRLAGFLYRLADRIAGRYVGSPGLANVEFVDSPTVKRTPLQRKRATKAKP